MTRVDYTIKTFNDRQAAIGALCVMVKKGYPGDSISNIDTSTGKANTNFGGAGICVYKAPNAFYFHCNGQVYSFNEKGVAVSNNAVDYKLMLAELTSATQKEIQSVGNYVKIRSIATTKRADPIEPTFNTQNVNATLGDSISPDPDSGSDSEDIDREGIIYDTEVNYNKDTTIVVDSLNARDQFAIQCLNGLLQHVEFPSSLSDNEINYYCGAAYRWASNMMAASANSRSIAEEVSQSSTPTAAVGTLESNTEKLLNNIVSALEKCNAKMDRYIQGESSGATVGLKELIAAIPSSSGGGGGSTDVSGIVNALRDSTDPDTLSDHLGAMTSIFSERGGSTSSPMHVSCAYTFPKKNGLGNNEFTATTASHGDSSRIINSLFVFNSPGTPGWSSPYQIAWALARAVLNIDISSSDPDASATDFKSLFDLIISNANLELVKSSINGMIKEWLSNNTETVTIDGNTYIVIRNGSLNNS